MTSALDADRLALGRLGWDCGWAEAFAPFAERGHRPARVVAVHRETSIVRDGSGSGDGDGDRAAQVAGSFRFEALGPSDYPAIQKSVSDHMQRKYGAQR